ncbi:MFS family permease [Allocatelliglobosispora scoriae]|uniref:MFS family permease n=1 Tax=Allocatelliglobosispora scoriae TaxID=643052 RepID=A0A841BHJ9_9ACTN|nr:MFS transporter [Allocatelliglobosispora scoriae]MBB5866798.1 MFS family permease [Allocatelliglobosispora scoriae]
MNLTLLRHRDFSLLWWAGLLSMTGDWALRIALPIYVLRLTGSPATVAATVLASLAAGLLLGVPAGICVDRWDRRRVLVATSVLQAVALLPLLAVSAAPRAWIVVVVAFAEAALAQFAAPAEGALLPRLVPADRLAAANALNALNNFVARLAGPVLGGAVVATLGLSGAAVLDAATFALAALLVALIGGRHRADREEHRLRYELVEGLRAVARNRIARAILVFVTVISIGEGMMLTLFAAFVTRALHAGAREMSWLLAAQAVGGIIGSLAATRLTRARPVALAAVCFALFGLGDLLIINYPRWSDALWPVIVLFFLIGVPGAIGSAAAITLFQQQTVDRLRGRAFAALAMCQAVAGMVGAAVAGALGDRVGVMDLLTVQGAAHLLAAGLLRLLAGPGPESAAPRSDVPEAAAVP